MMIVHNVHVLVMLYMYYSLQAHTHTHTHTHTLQDTCNDIRNVVGGASHLGRNQIASKLTIKVSPTREKEHAVIDN